MDKEKILIELEEKIKNKELIKIIFSSKISGDFEKVIVKPIILKNGASIQFESFKENKAFHNNVSFENFSLLTENLKNNLENFSQILLQIQGKDILFVKKKEYFLNEGKKIDFLIELNVMSPDGKVNKNSYNKFRQINKYLEFIDDTIGELKEKKLIKEHIKVLDFGCGKSYLTFALYYYLKNFRKELSFSIIGLDLKKDVINFCNNLAQKLNYKNLKFLNGDIKNYENPEEVDLVFSLHACNNATDYSLEKALSLNAKAILAVPCCHHEFFDKILKNKKSEFYSNLKIMADNGVVLDKFASLATDSFRSLSLELCGYKTKILEFIDVEHTPKNILIKAIKNKNINLAEKKKEYDNLKNFLGINPLLEELIKKYFITL